MSGGGFGAWANLTGVKMDGKAVADSVLERIGAAVARLKEDGSSPCLATILVGDDPASATYVRNKHKACTRAGIETRDHRLDADAPQEDVNRLISSLNEDDTIHGILVQLPLPGQLDAFEVISRISPIKDVDGLTPHNAGLLAMKKAVLVACTPAGIMEILDHYEIPLEGRDAVIINRSSLVGIPLYHLMIQRNATVTMCHSRSSDLEGHCRGADIVITAVGDRSKFKLVPDIIRDGAVVVDVAISRSDGRLVGDADYNEIIEKASHATPVPGGVGPMTVAMLLKNTVTATSLTRSLGSTH